MKCFAQRNCYHCNEFYLPDRRNLHHQRYCSKPSCRKQSKAESQRRWLQKPDNQSYFSGPQNSQRVKEWRKRHPGYWRKKKSAPEELLQDLCRTQVAQNEEVKRIEASNALQEVLLMQPAVMVGLISMMTGSALQEDIAATTRALQPIELFALEKLHLNALPPLPADTGMTKTVGASRRFRVVLDTNRYSVPSLYASQRLLLKRFADRLCIYHDEKLIATHTRSYARHQGFEDPDHGKELLDRRRAARDSKLLLRFYCLCPRAEEYYLQLKLHRLNPRQHIAKIMTLSEVHSRDKVARAIEDSFEFQAFSSDYIANILEQRERFSPQPSPLHLTRRQDLLEVELDQPDLSVCEGSNIIPIVPKP
jgi:hypothetical protein